RTAPTRIDGKVFTMAFEYRNPMIVLGRPTQLGSRRPRRLSRPYVVLCSLRKSTANALASPWPKPCSAFNRATSSWQEIRPVSAIRRPPVSDRAAVRGLDRGEVRRGAVSADGPAGVSGRAGAGRPVFVWRLPRDRS